MSHSSAVNISSPESMEKSHWSFWIGKLLNIAAFGATYLSCCNFVRKIALFGNDEAHNEKWVSGCTLLLVFVGTTALSWGV